MKSDAELVSEAQQGKEQAFSELMGRYKERAIRMAYVHVGNYEDAKDVSQEAFVKTYRALGRFESKAKFSTWFYRILVNTANDFLRKRRLKNLLVWKKNETMDNFFESVADTKASPDESIQNQELGEQMSRAIQNLPEKQRWVFTLRFLENMTLEEIAAATGTALGTVKASLHFATEKFKKEFQGHEL
jgi:RNA polymerase sigma-70 factor (ECF subfamily)